MTVLLAGAAIGANWTSAYTDDFSTDTARQDSCIQSLFWLDRATPPPGPYLYYTETGWDRQLAFMGYQNQLAELGYCFPITTVHTQRVVKGWLSVDVSFPTTAIISQYPQQGQLLYSTSGDGVAWSEAQSLGAGRQQVPIESASGAAYVRLAGTRVVIDNLQVSLSSPPATISVRSNSGTIQAAINAAANGDVIEVGPGTYSGSDIQFGGKAITLRSTDGPASTIIDVADGRRGFYFRGGEGADSVLSGFTIRNARASGARGGGIYCEYSSPTIVNCIIENCSADVGGGIGVWGAAPTITDCIISGCSAAAYGGGIALLQQSDATITRCEITDNTASSGGGIHVSDSRALVGGCRISGNSVPSNKSGGGAFCTGILTDATFKNCVIVSNSAGIGGGIYTESSLGFQRGATIVNCTIAYNQVPYPQPGGGIYSVGTDIFVTNTIVWGNGNNPLTISNAVLAFPVTYSNIEGGGHWGEGNLNAPPLFVDAGAGDYHLQSVHGRYDPLWGWVRDGESSPGIDAGAPGMSAADEPSPNGGRVNMGAYGATREASKSPEYRIWHVNIAGGSNTFNGLSQERAFRTIQRALDVAGHGDTVLVWPGVYREEIVFGGKAVTLRSAADAAVLVAPVAYAVSFYSDEGPKSVLSNFVIRDCPQGAIFFDGASPTLRNLTIVNNGFGIVPGYGYGDPYVVNCIFWGNGGDVSGCRAYYSRVQSSADARQGNISKAPEFADPENDDFHLKSAYGRYVPTDDGGVWETDSVTSPCIDTGNPEDYYEAELEPNGDVINMGAYGGTPYASKSRY
jgi:hypothetical protein